MGKGSTRRDQDIDDSKMKSNWDLIFKKTIEQFNDGQRKQSEALQQPPVRDSGHPSDGTHELLPR
jgi:hypothetical protein